MDIKAKQIVEKLTKNGQTISVMESCTGGAFSNAITNVPGSSEVFKFGAVTYSNEFKTKLGVKKSVIRKFSVYSLQVAREMSKEITNFSGADYGVGITGKLKKVDTENGYGKDDEVFFCVFSRKNNQFFDGSLIVDKDSREENKNMVLQMVLTKILEIL